MKNIRIALISLALLGIGTSCVARDESPPLRYEKNVTMYLGAEAPVHVISFPTSFAVVPYVQLSVLPGGYENYMYFPMEALMPVTTEVRRRSSVIRFRIEWNVSLGALVYKDKPDKRQWPGRDKDIKIVDQAVIQRRQAIRIRGNC